MFVFTPTLRDRLVQSAEDYVKSRVFNKDDRNRAKKLLAAINESSDESVKMELALFELNSIVKEFDFKKIIFEYDYRMNDVGFFVYVAKVLRFIPNVESIEFSRAEFTDI